MKTLISVVVCPEHENWQIRTQSNPLVLCRPFYDDVDSSQTSEGHDAEEDDVDAERGRQECSERNRDLIVDDVVLDKPKRTILAERDMNIGIRHAEVTKRIKI